MKELYAIIAPDKAEGKLGNASVLSLLNDLEKQLDHYLLEFKESELIDPSIILEEQKKIKKE